MSKTNSVVHVKHFKCRCNETDSEISQFLRTLKFVSLTSHEKCFWCYFWQMFTSLAFKKCRKDCNLLNVLP